MDNGDWTSELEAVAAHASRIAYSSATKLVINKGRYVMLISNQPRPGRHPPRVKMRRRRDVEVVQAELRPGYLSLVALEEADAASVRRGVRRRPGCGISPAGTTRTATLEAAPGVACHALV